MLLRLISLFWVFSVALEYPALPKRILWLSPGVSGTTGPALMASGPINSCILQQSSSGIQFNPSTGEVTANLVTKLSNPVFDVICLDSSGYSETTSIGIFLLGGVVATVTLLPPVSPSCAGLGNSFTFLMPTPRLMTTDFVNMTCLSESNFTLFVSGRIDTTVQPSYVYFETRTASTVSPSFMFQLGTTVPSSASGNVATIFINDYGGLPDDETLLNFAFSITFRTAQRVLSFRWGGTSTQRFDIPNNALLPPANVDIGSLAPDLSLDEWQRINQLSIVYDTNVPAAPLDPALLCFTPGLWCQPQASGGPRLSGFSMPQCPGVSSRLVSINETALFDSLSQTFHGVTLLNLCSMESPNITMDITALKPSLRTLSMSSASLPPLTTTLTNLTTLWLFGSWQLLPSNFSILFPSLQRLRLKSPLISHLPTFPSLSQMLDLNFDGCLLLSTLPSDASGLCTFPNLQNLSLADTRLILNDTTRCTFGSIENVNLRNTPIQSLPPTLCSKRVASVKLSGCQQLQNVSAFIRNNCTWTMAELDFSNTSLTRLQSTPASFSLNANIVNLSNTQIISMDPTFFAVNSLDFSHVRSMNSSQIPVAIKSARRIIATNSTIVRPTLNWLNGSTLVVVNLSSNALTNAELSTVQFATSLTAFSARNNLLSDSSVIFNLLAKTLCSKFTELDLDSNRFNSTEEFSRLGEFFDNCSHTSLPISAFSLSFTLTHTHKYIEELTYFFGLLAHAAFIMSRNLLTGSPRRLLDNLRSSLLGFPINVDLSGNLLADPITSWYSTWTGSNAILTRNAFYSVTVPPPSSTPLFVTSDQLDPWLSNPSRISQLIGLYTMSQDPLYRVPIFLQDNSIGGLSREGPISNLASNPIFQPSIFTPLLIVGVSSNRVLIGQPFILTLYTNINNTALTTSTSGVFCDRIDSLNKMVTRTNASHLVTTAYGSTWSCAFDAISDGSPIQYLRLAWPNIIFTNQSSTQVVSLSLSCRAGYLLNSTDLCEPCLPGFRGFLSSISNQSACTECEVASFAPSPASTQCTSCPPDRTTRDVGKSQPSDCLCRRGTYSGGDPTRCFPCPIGAICDDIGVEWPRIQPGYFVLNNSNEVLVTLACSPTTSCVGSISNTSEAQCDAAAGYGGFGCGQCVPGYFRRAGECFKCPNSNSSNALWLAMFVCAMALCALFVMFGKPSKRAVFTPLLVVSFVQLLQVRAYCVDRSNSLSLSLSPKQFPSIGSREILCAIPEFCIRILFRVFILEFGPSNLRAGMCRL